MSENDDFQIELGQSVRRHVEHKKNPLEDGAMRALPFDSPNSDQVPVFIAESVMRSIEKHVLGEKDKEVGGVLLGSFYRSEGGAFVEVTDFIEAKSAKGTDVSLTFTHETWEQISAEQAARNPDLQMVGWYHSHPALGVFMSREDEFIHSNFFSEPWHVAVVVDPIYHNWGCFKWKDGALERTGGFYVFAEKKAGRRLKEYVSTLSGARQAPPRAASASADRREPASGKSSAALWIAVVLLVLAQVVTGYLALSGRSAAGKDEDRYKTAIELLSKSDLSGGAQYLRMELVAHPNNMQAYREMQRLDAVASMKNDRLDEINFTLAMADRMATGSTDFAKRSELEGLGLSGPNSEKTFSAKLEATDPVRNALAVYASAATTRAARMNRAEMIAKAAGAAGKARGVWYDRAVKWLAEERLREIAYGLHSGGEGYEKSLARLSDADKAAVKRIRAELVKPK